MTEEEIRHKREWLRGMYPQLVTEHAKAVADWIDDNLIGDPPPPRKRPRWSWPKCLRVRPWAAILCGGFGLPTVMNVCVAVAACRNPDRISGDVWGATLVVSLTIFLFSTIFGLMAWDMGRDN